MIDTVKIDVDEDIRPLVSSFHKMGSLNGSDHVMTKVGTYQIEVRDIESGNLVAMSDMESDYDASVEEFILDFILD